MIYVLFALAGYLIGSIPFAYLITKRMAGVDLRKEGSKNIGTLNSYEVTGSKRVGLSVLLLDLSKGLLPTFGTAFLTDAISTSFVAAGLVLGHCYPVFLRFHGGRGLATAAGAFLVLNPIMVLVWVAGYLIARRFRDHVHIGNIGATAISIVYALGAPDAAIGAGMFLWPAEAEFIQLQRFTGVFVMLVVLSRHMGPLRELRTR